MILLVGCTSSSELKSSPDYAAWKSLPGYTRHLENKSYKIRSGMTRNEINKFTKTLYIGRTHEINGVSRAAITYYISGKAYDVFFEDNSFDVNNRVIAVYQYRIPQQIIIKGKNFNWTWTAPVSKPKYQPDELFIGEWVRGKPIKGLYSERLIITSKLYQYFEGGNLVMEGPSIIKRHSLFMAPKINKSNYLPFRNGCRLHLAAPNKLSL